MTVCESRYCRYDGPWGGFCYLHDKVRRGLISGYYDGSGTSRPLRLHEPPGKVFAERRGTA